MKISHKLMLFVMTSVILLTVLCAAVAYYFMQQSTIDETMKRLHQETTLLMSMHSVNESGRWVEHPVDFKYVLPLLFQSGRGYAGEQHFLLDAQQQFMAAGQWQNLLDEDPTQFARWLDTQPDAAALFARPLTEQPHIFTEPILLQGRAYRALGVRVGVMKWHYFRLIPVDEVLAPMQALFINVIGMMLLLGLLIGLLIEWAVRRNVVARLENLTGSVRRYGQGELSVRAPIEGNDEITYAERDFDEMADNIEQLRQVEAMLRSREQATLQSSLDGIHIMDRHGNVIESNPAFCRMLGYSHEELLSMNVVDWDVGKTPEEIQNNFYRLIHDKQSLLFETQHKCKDGKVLQVEINTAPMLFDNEPYIWASSRDITARKRAEEIIRKNEERFRYMLETSPIAVRIAAPSGLRVLFANQRYAKLINVSPAQVLGVNPQDYYAHPQTYADILQQLHAGDVVTDRLIQLNIPNSHTRWVLASYLRVEYANEQCVLGWFYDVTELRNAEHELRIAAQAFETQEGIVVTDSQGIIIRVNHSFTRMTGYSAAEVLGNRMALLKSGLQDADFYKKLWDTLLHEQFWQGELWNKRKNGEIYPEWLTITAVQNEDGKTNNYVGIFSDITERKHAEQQIHQLAFYDPLTRLPNRRLLMDRLQQGFAASARNGQHGALIFMDLDHFKTLNDTRGHDIGDLLLIEVAVRTQACVREGDTVARLGGDEFVVVLENLSKNATEAAKQAEVVADKIRLALSQPYMLKNLAHYSTPSVGIALFLGHQENIDDLLKHADTAMYQAKTAGRNAIRFYDPTMQAALEARILLEAELRKAVEQQQFELYYQVQVNAQRQVIGVEALLRWQYQQSVVSPNDFIPLAEETGLIIPIGQWVLQTACAQLTCWQRQRVFSSLSIAVNVSAKQFRQADFVEQMQHILNRTGADPSLLKLELTESTVLADVEDAIHKMRELKRLGVRFSMDDFGTGYSSLSYLKRLPLDQIKIDQSFVRDITTDQNDAAIVQTIIAMSEALGLNVIAEGVESNAQCEFLDLRGCHAFQGYLFGKPESLAQLQQRLAAGL